jgi:hypothetical protein
MKIPQPPRKDDPRFDDWSNLLWKLVSGMPPENLTGFNALPDYANDAAAAVGGVAIGSLYRNGSAIMVRVA